MRQAALLLGLTALLPLATAAADDTVLRVTTRLFSEIAVPVTRSAPAQVESMADATVAARLATEVAAFHVRTGDRVDAGMILARLDCDDFEDRQEQARGRLLELTARRDLADLRLERLRRLREQDAVAVETLDEAEAEMRALAGAARAQRAELQSANREVERCIVHAPFDGIVTARLARVGEFVQPGTAILQMIDRARVELAAHLNLRDVDSLRAAGQASFRADGHDHAVTLRRLVDDVDPRTRTREARFEFDDAPPLPGITGRVHWQLAARALPADFVVRRDARLGVMLVVNGRARFEPLANAVEGRPVPAAELADDAVVILRGRHAARDGEPVRAGPADDS